MDGHAHIKLHAKEHPLEVIAQPGAKEDGTDPSLLDRLPRAIRADWDLSCLNTRMSPCGQRSRVLAHAHVKSAVHALFILARPDEFLLCQRANAQIGGSALKPTNLWQK